MTSVIFLFLPEAYSLLAVLNVDTQINDLYAGRKYMVILCNATHTLVHVARANNFYFKIYGANSA